MITALDHLQVAMPAGREERARGFYSDLLGLDELEKPAALAARGGAWFGLPDGRQLHLGVDEPFRPSKKGHPAFVVSSLDELAGRMSAEGLAVRWDQELAPRRRFYGEDPFGNRMEFLEPWRYRHQASGSRDDTGFRMPAPKPQNLDPKASDGGDPRPVT